MRMRRKKNLDARLAACADYLISDGATLKGKWRDRFSAQGELYVEIGCGKGRFIIEHAKQYPDRLFVAVEREQNVLVMAVEHAISENLSNLLFLDCDAALLGDVFAPDEVQGIYLNFSDPWPPKKQWKRRLTHSSFLSVYESFLTEGGCIVMKTDNKPLFEFSLCEFSRFGFVLSEVSLDLHATDIPNIMTEYEQNFASCGISICRCVAQKGELK